MDLQKYMRTWTSVVKKKIGEIEETSRSTQVDVESLRNEMKNRYGSATSTGSVEELNERILHLEKQLKLETARNEHAIRAVYEMRELNINILSEGQREN